VQYQPDARQLSNTHDFDSAADAQAQCYASNDIKEGILAIKEKRPPVFNK